MSRLDEEIAAHLDRLTAEHVARGLSPEEARAAARRDFGGVTQVREAYRDQSRPRWVDDFRADARHAIRTLRGAPGFAAVVILTLGLGIGANTAIFSVLNGVVLKPLPYADGDRLVVLQQSAPLSARPVTSVSVKELYDYRDQTQAFDALVEYHQMTFDLLNRGEPDRVNVGVVSHDFFNVLGIQPLAGRGFRATDDVTGADAVLLLSHSYWQTRFSGDAHIVGQVFEMNDRPHTVIGVLPDVPHYPQDNDVYMPVSACPFRAGAEQASLSNRRAFSALTVFGRLRDGITRERAAGEVWAVASRFVRENATVYRPGSGFRATALDVRDEMVKDARPLLLILIGATGLVLLIACANVANLSLSRLLRRERELAVRAALGAARGRLIRQLLTESMLLSLLGSLVGLALAASTVTMLTTFVGRFTARTGEVSIDAGVLGFTLLVSLVTAVTFGALPALLARGELQSVMRSGRSGGDTPGRRRAQAFLVVAQVAVSVVLLVGAALLLASFYRLRDVDAGYRVERIVSAEAFGNFSRYQSGDSLVRFYESVVTRLEAEPGVASVAISNAVPLSTVQPFNAPLQIEGAVDDRDQRPIVDPRVVTPNYFATLGIPVLSGRPFNALDRSDAPPVALVNRAMLRHWEGREVLGSRISLDNGQTWRQVVGVVGDVRQFGLELEALPQVYTPLAQSQGLAGLILVRTSGGGESAADAGGAAAAIRRAVQAVDPQMPVENVRTLEELRGEYLARPQLTATLLLIFAALALAVTLTGITGVMAMSVSHRLREFGVRLALGATRPQILGVVLKEGTRLVAAGLVLGLGASLLVRRFLSAYLFETAATDPLMLGAVAATLLIAGTLACLSPAWRATRVEPIIALQAD